MPADHHAVRVHEEGLESLSHPLGRAAKGDLEGVQRDVARFPSLLRACMGGHTRTLVWEAVRFGRREVFDWLLEQGAVWDHPGRYRAEIHVLTTPYVLARTRPRRRDFAEALAALGPWIDVWAAAFLGDGERLAGRVAEQPGDLWRPQPEDEVFRLTPAHHALHGGHADLLAWCLAADEQASAAALPEHGPSLFAGCLERGWDDLADELSRRGVSDEAIPFEVALERSDLLERLLATGFDIDVPDRGWPRLAYACRGDRGGDLARVTALLDHGADPDRPGPRGKTPLHCAAKAGFAAIVELLLSRGADPNRRLDDGSRPLDLARRAHRTATVALLEPVTPADG